MIRQHKFLWLLIAIFVSACGATPAQDDANSDEQQSVDTSQEAYRDTTMPVFKDDSPSTKPFSGVEIRPQESILSVGNRIVFARNYTRLIFDFDGGTTPPDLVRAKKAFNIKEDNLFSDISTVFEDGIPNLSIYLAIDRGGQAMVVTNRSIQKWQSYEVYDVLPGTVKNNSMRLANLLGWKIEDVGGWLADDFTIATTYPIIVSADDIRTSFERLLDNYPAQARISPNTGNITVVHRLQPKK